MNPSVDDNPLTVSFNRKTCSCPHIKTKSNIKSKRHYDVSDRSCILLGEEVLRYHFAKFSTKNACK